MAKFFSLPANLGVSGTSVICPENPILPNGSVNFIFNIRGIPQGDTAMANAANVNAVIITAEAGGVGSLENMQRFGNAQFINNSIRKILEVLSKKNNGITPSIGNIYLSSWSGGYAAIREILKQKSSLIAPITGITVFDGIHEKTPDQIKPWTDFAKETQKDPSKKFVIVHTDIKPPYTSSTESADAITNSIGATKNQNGEVNSGGFYVYHIQGADAKAHIAARDMLPQIWNKHLGDNNNAPIKLPENHIEPKQVESNKIDQYFSSAFNDLKNLN